MADFDDALIAKLVVYARQKMRGGPVEKVRDDVLDYAYDPLGFDGDQTVLWAAVKLGVQYTPAENLRPLQQQTRHNPSPRRSDPQPKADPWRPEDKSLVTAPYRFTPVNTKVSRPIGVSTPLDLPVPGNLSAVLDVVWQVETPLLIGESNGADSTATPFKLGDAYSIPGATLRGAVRAVTETIGFCRLFQISRHNRFALRDFVHPTYKAFITSGQGIPGLQAGWLSKTADGPQITPCD